MSEIRGDLASREADYLGAIAQNKKSKDPLKVDCPACGATCSEYCSDSIDDQAWVCWLCERVYFSEDVVSFCVYTQGGLYNYGQVVRGLPMEQQKIIRQRAYGDIYKYFD